MIGALLNRARAFFAIPPIPNVRTVEDIMAEVQTPPGAPTPECEPFDFYLNGGSSVAHYHTGDNGLRRAYEGSRCPHLRPIFDEATR
jgi:hypothetical protein